MDTRIFELIHGWAGQYKILDLVGIFLADYLGYILLIVFIVLIFLEKNWRRRLYQLFLGLLSIILTRGVIVEVIRFFYESPRPYITLVFKPLIDLEISNSFPSGHVSAFLALATAILLFNRSTPLTTSRKWGYCFFVGAILIGLARIFVGVHWPTDILGGIVVGILGALIVWKFLPKSNYLN